MNIKTLLTTALGVLSTFAAYTSTKLDDMAVSVLTAVVGNEALMDFIESLLGNAEVVAATGDARTSLIRDLANRKKTDEVEEAVVGAGLGWAALIEVLPVIIRILLTLKGQRKA